ncbi:MAG: hypothetical protein AABO58_17095 [Acidobacteriota bacterium]
MWRRAIVFLFSMSFLLACRTASIQNPDARRATDSARQQRNLADVQPPPDTPNAVCGQPSADEERDRAARGFDVFKNPIDAAENCQWFPPPGVTSIFVRGVGGGGGGGALSTVTLEAMAAVVAHHWSRAVPAAMVVSTAMLQPQFVVIASQRFRARAIRGNGAAAAAVPEHPARQTKEDSTVAKVETAKF